MHKPIDLNDIDMKFWMAQLIQRASQVGHTGEVPVAAVILDYKGRCIGHGRNQRTNARNPLGHAELIALRQASWINRDWRFNDCTLLVTLEPCPMCAGALVQARMGQVIYGASDSKRGGLGGTINLANHESSHHKMKIIGGVLEKEAQIQLKEWFRSLRNQSLENGAIQFQKD